MAHVRINKGLKGRVDEEEMNRAYGNGGLIKFCLVLLFQFFTEKKKKGKRTCF